MYDMLVIGGGSGGYASAIRASQLGGRVAVVEAGETGGVCVNRGCIPSKIWLRAAYLLHMIKHGEEFGIRVEKATSDLAAIGARKNGVANDIRMGMEALLANNKVELIRGYGTLKNPGEVDVDGRNLTAKNVIVATGSRLEIPDIPGLEDAALTTDQVLDMTLPPESVLIWGEAGPIELEMAVLLQSFGARVYLAADGSRLLPKEDGETGQRMAQALREQGINVMTRSKLESIKPVGKLFEASFAGKEATVSVEKILVGKRRPNVERLGLKALGAVFNEDGGIKVNDYLETGVKGVYAIGDATGGWMLSHGASSMAVTAAENAMGDRHRFPFHLIPRAMWTIPQAAAVGLSEEEAEEDGHDVAVGSFPYSINGLAMAYGEMTGAVKWVVDSKHGEILGIHIVGANATELIGEAQMAMQLEATPTELARGIRAHPTFSEAVVDAARDVGDWALYLPRR
jgi:dihydrolipoamide dehydrogenase